MRARRRWLLSVHASLAVVALLGPHRAAAQHWRIVDPGQGAVPLAAGAAGASELSGLAWLGDDRYVAVSDGDGRLHRLRIDVDPASGRIRAAAPVSALALPDSRDAEGVAVTPDGASVVVSDEVGPAVRQYRLRDGALERTAALPPVFAAERGNLGLEALTRDPSGHYWTANEEALRVDGPTSTATEGTLVRLLRLDAALQPAGEWAYRTDPVFGAPVLKDRGTGLSELAALPDGRLLALERSFGTSGLRIRLYEIGLAGATELSDLARLAETPVTAVTKALLWEHASLDENFEGMALGPRLADGSDSLILISDDGHRLVQALYPLRIGPAAEAGAAEPAAAPGATPAH
jgi:hypothetical protein